MDQQRIQALQEEWSILQNNIENYEGMALWIKIFAIAVFIVLGVLFKYLLLTICLCSILALQEAILRTSQSRLCERIESLEDGFALLEVTPFQLHTEWKKKRPGNLGLVVEYLRQLLRPTIAFPYIVLIALAIYLRQ